MEKMQNITEKLSLSADCEHFYQLNLSPTSPSSVNHVLYDINTPVTANAFDSSALNTGSVELEVHAAANGFIL